MKKKLSAIALTAILVMAIGVSPVFAAGSLPTEDEIEYQDVNGNSGITGQIPVYGYIGADADIDDPDPEDPNVPPEPNVYEVNVSVPVKIFWAAFESDNGAVKSPNYKIKNNSKDTGTNNHDLDISLIGFEATAGAAQDLVTAGELTLNLIGDIEAGNVVGTTPATAVALTTAKELPANITWIFKIGGAYTGGFTTELNPVYNMVLEFSVDQ
jgi:hypothetical protein